MVICSLRILCVEYEAAHKDSAGHSPDPLCSVDIPKENTLSLVLREPIHTDDPSALGKRDEMTHSPVQGSPSPLVLEPTQLSPYSAGGSLLRQGEVRDDTSRDPFSHTGGHRRGSWLSLSPPVPGSRLIRNFSLFCIMSPSEPVWGHTLPSK